MLVFLTILSSLMKSLIRVVFFRLINELFLSFLGFFDLILKLFHFLPPLLLPIFIFIKRSYFFVEDLLYLSQLHFLF